MELLLSGNAQGNPAGSDDLDEWCRRKKLCKPAGRPDYLLEVIEHQQHVPVGQEFNQQLNLNKI